LQMCRQRVRMLREKVLQVPRVRLQMCRQRGRMLREKVLQVPRVRLQVCRQRVRMLREKVLQGRTDTLRIHQAGIMAGLPSTPHQLL